MPDLSNSSISTDVKLNEIINVNGMKLFGFKDYTGNIQSINVIQTNHNIYTIDNDRITQIQSEYQMLTFVYNNSINQYYAVVNFENGSYEVPISYKTPTITFPKPLFSLPINEDPPDPFTGFLIELRDKSTTAPLEDASVQLKYVDQNLGNRTAIMINVGAGRYYASLPTNDTSFDKYFSSKNLYETLSQQSVALMELIRNYPISDICSKAPNASKKFCSSVEDEMTALIPQSLSTGSKYSSDIIPQSKSPGVLSDFEVAIWLSGQSPIIQRIDFSENAGSTPSDASNSAGTSIDTSKLTTFSLTINTVAGKCNQQTVAGNDIPDDRIINIGKAHTEVKFNYQTYTVKDKIDVYYTDRQVFTSTCIGTGIERTTYIKLDNDESSLRVSVTPDCAGDTGTAWYYSIECLFDSLICDGDVCYCGVRKSLSTQKNAPTINGCGADGGISSYFNWIINGTGNKWHFTPFCNHHDECYGKCNNFKKTCDLTFFNEMSSSCTTDWTKASDIESCQTWANIFYKAVKWFAGGAFKTAQGEDCECTTV